MRPIFTTTGYVWLKIAGDEKLFSNEGHVTDFTTGRIYRLLKMNFYPFERISLTEQEADMLTREASARDVAIDYRINEAD